MNLLFRCYLIFDYSLEKVFLHLETVDMLLIKLCLSIRQKTVWVSLMMMIAWGSVAQSGDNPFEMQHRLDTTKKTSEETTSVSSVSDNPFDIKRLPDSRKSKKEIPQKSVIPTITKETNLTSDKNFRFWTTIGILILLAIMSSLYRNQLTRAFRAFSNENVMRMLQRERGTVAHLPYYIWFIFFIINGGFYVYLLMKYFKVSIATNWQMFSFALIAVGIIFFLKKLTIRLLGYIFPIPKEADLYNLTITIFGIVMGIVLVVLNLFLAYSPEHLLKGFVVFSFITIGGIYLFRSLRGLSISSKFFGFHKFHFFIYLCTVEIAPVLILWKMIAMNTGIQ